MSFAAIDGIAAAAGPGLIGGVIVGLTTAKAIALVQEKPLIAVNHLEAHALTARLTDDTPFPYCLFLASGGHTQIVAVLGVGSYLPHFEAGALVQSIAFRLADSLPRSVYAGCKSDA